MSKAYNILMRKRNQNLYGNEWLIVKDTNFTDQISFKLIGRIDGNATINLLNANKKIVATLQLTTQAEEATDEIISSLINLAVGEYILQYSDGTNTKSITLHKQFFDFAKEPVTSVAH
jgi:hypothetical protein